MIIFHIISWSKLIKTRKLSNANNANTFKFKTTKSIECCKQILKGSIIKSRDEYDESL